MPKRALGETDLSKKVLIASCYAKGGVVSMRRKIAQYLQNRGYEPTLAYYAPYKLYPELSTPLWKLGRHSTQLQKTTEDGIPTYRVGTALPEWEFLRHRPSPHWKQLIDEHDYHIVVSGTIHPAAPLVAAGQPVLAWIATPYLEERLTHWRDYPWYRKIPGVLDTGLCAAEEKLLLGKTHLLALSPYTAKNFQKSSPQAVSGILPMPVDETLFSPPGTSSPASERPASTQTIGFVGRFNDPRKNTDLLLQAFALAREAAPELRLKLIGDQSTPKLEKLLQSLSIDGSVEITPFVERSELRSIYQSMNCFVIPSTQEGLAIVGLEAMACGLPVISTRCGGPESYIDLHNGRLVDFHPQSLSNAILEICGSPSLQKELSQGALQTVRDQFSDQIVSKQFWDHFDSVYLSPKPER